VLGAQALERRDDILLSHLQSIRDHTRGLFEAEASVAVSAAHALKNVKFFFFIGHPFSSRGPGLRCHARKPHLLCRDQLSLGLRLACSVHNHANPNEDTPCLPGPARRENHKGVFSNQPGRLIAAYTDIKLSGLTRGDIQRRVKSVIV